VTTFFRVDARHDGKIYGFSKGDKISVALVFDLQCLLLLFLLVILTIIAIVLASFPITTLPKNLSFCSSVFLFVLLPLWIKLEDIQTILHVDLII